MNHPDLVKALPRDMIAAAWDYDGRISYEDQLRPFVDAGIETWVAPGVSDWSRACLATQLWIGRADRVDQARQRWYRERALPTAAEVGIPEVGGDQ